MKYKTYLKLEESTFIYRTENFNYYFSSEARLKRFQSRVNKSREDFSIRMKVRYNIKVKASDYIDFNLYSICEVKGFHVIRNDTQEVIKCLNDIILDGNLVTKKS